MAAERLENSDDSLNDRESLRGWISGGLPEQADVIEFPLNQGQEQPLYDADKFQLGGYWEMEVEVKPAVKPKLNPRGAPINISLSEADDLTYQLLIEQEQIEPEAPAYGVHPQHRRYPSGFRKDEWNHHFGVKD